MGAGFGRWQEKSDKNVVPRLEISIDRVQDLAISRKNQTKSLNKVSGLKIDGCMHPLPQIDSCSCTHRTCTNKGHGKYLRMYKQTDITQSWLVRHKYVQ